MIKLSIKLDVSLGKLVFGFVGLSAAAAAVYYLSSKNEMRSNEKVEGPFISNGKNNSNLLTVGKTEVSERTHVQNEITSESKTDEGNIKNNSLQYVHEDSQKQIIFDTDESFSASEEDQSLSKTPPIPGTNLTFPNKGDGHDAVDENKSSSAKGETKVPSVGVQSSSISSKNLKQTDDSQISEKDNKNVEKEDEPTSKVIKNISDNILNSEVLKLDKANDDCSSSQKFSQNS